MMARAMYSRVGVEAGLETVEEARAATAAVLRALRDRLTPREAEQAAAQLPTELKALWWSESGTRWPPMKMHREAFLERVRTDAGLRDLRTAALVVDAVFAALKDQLSEGEGDDILAQLPRDLKRMWVHA
jgi:uncharacterized protein (DUF2267 family)